jgi:CRISPR/Cas system-associated endoribonuclease Cas2
LLSGFGTRVQYSAFEVIQTKPMLTRIEWILEDDDNVRVYRVRDGDPTIMRAGARLTELDVDVI